MGRVGGSGGAVVGGGARSPFSSPGASLFTTGVGVDVGGVEGEGSGVISVGVGESLPPVGGFGLVFIGFSLLAGSNGDSAIKSCPQIRNWAASLHLKVPYFDSSCQAFSESSKPACRTGMQIAESKKLRGGGI